MNEGLSARPEAALQAYRRAQEFLPWGAAALSTRNVSVLPFWTEEDSATSFRFETTAGWEFRSWRMGGEGAVVSFDHARLAKGLSHVLQREVDPLRLPFFCFEKQAHALRFNLGTRSFEADVRDGAVREMVAARTADSVRSPDRRWVASIGNQDIYLRADDRGEARRLTTDGAPSCGYGAWPEGNLFELSRRNGSIVLAPPIGWSPDSRFFVTHRLDQSEVGQLHLIDSTFESATGRPKLHSYRYALPAESARPYSTLFVVDTVAGKATPLEIPPLQSVVLPPVPQLGYWWSSDSKRILAIRWTKGRSRIELFEADPFTGRARVVMEEEGPAWLRPTHNYQASANIRFLAASGEIVWCSERSGWSHLYLHDAASGSMTAAITSGEWLVDAILHIDERRRRIYFSGRGRESGRDPYERYVYSANLDGSALRLLTPEPGDHLVHTPAPPTAYALGGDEAVLVARGFAPTGECFVESYSRVDLPPVTRVRSCENGTILAELACADVSALEKAGWQPPRRVQLKGRDGATDIYGTLWAPSSLEGTSAARPLIDIVYPGPHANLAPCAFTSPRTRTYFWPEALAALGFAVVMIDGMGTPYRARDFVNFAYRNLGDAGLPDHAAAFAQLQARFSWIDTDRIGVIGASAGGYASARALLQFPEIFKVAISACGSHDIRLIHAAWAEILEGTSQLDADAAERRFEDVSNYGLADRLQGKLMIAHGDLDENVHPSVSIRLADALIKANKDFDFLPMPGRGHNFVNDRYFVRRAFDYLYRHLAGQEPPREFSFERKDNDAK